MKKKLLMLALCLWTIGLYAQTIVPLNFSRDGGNTFNEQLKAVKVGEYLWLNQNITDATLAGSAPTKEEIDIAHKRYVMFDYNRPPNQPTKPIEPTYWSYGVTLEEFHKYYGSYFPRWMQLDYRNNKRTFAKEGGSNTPKEWKLPEENDVLQLIAMCGNATRDEIRQYLSWDYADQTAPTFVKNIPPISYYWWFYHNPALIGGADSNGYNAANTNKYGFNWIPNGSSRYHADGATLVTENYGQSVSFTCKAGEFNGLNQVGSIALGSTASFSLNDYAEIKYGVSWETQTIRFCRPMTDDELGYKIYINQNMTGIDILTGDHESWVLPKRFKSGEENLLAKIRNGIVNINDIKIIKLPLGQYPPMGYDELPRGYIRGFYVQHILDNPAPKTVSQIITIALKNKRLWLNPDKVENIPTKPKTIALKYTEDGGKTFYDYEAVRIGEYLWMNSNFYNPVMNMPTRGEFDVMLGRYGIPASSYPMDMQVFNRYFGQYYNRDYIERMATAGKMQEGTAGYKTWKLPSQQDFEQLFAMCGNASFNEIKTYLGCKVGDNGAALWGDWYNGNMNKYGFNMMPGGARVHAPTDGYPTGTFYDMFLLSRFAADGGVTVSVKNGHALFTGKLWHWLNMRWSRRLTDDELGYKLYINTSHYNPSTGQYTSYDPAAVDIIKLGVNSTAPSGYTELPNGFLRGFYVQRVLEGTIKSALAPIAIQPENKLNAENSETSVTLYPNPVSNTLYLKSADQIQSVTIYNISGSLVFTKKGNLEDIDVSGLSGGVYFIKVKTQTGTHSHKFIKK